VIERFRAEHGTKPLRGLHREHIKKILAAKAATPESSNHFLKILRARHTMPTDSATGGASSAMPLDYSTAGITGCARLRLPGSAMRDARPIR
jgi:hypothetical protein